jgi:hypothetical protein
MEISLMPLRDTRIFYPRNSVGLGAPLFECHCVHLQTFVVGAPRVLAVMPRAIAANPQTIAESGRATNELPIIQAEQP